VLINGLPVRIRPVRARIDRHTKRDLRFPPDPAPRLPDPNTSSIDRPGPKAIVTSNFENSFFGLPLVAIGGILNLRQELLSFLFVLASLFFDERRMTRAYSKPVRLSPNFSCTGLSPWPRR
jgi:hypothetical protein